jgi:outer membrane receptor protein involved in Fe transport
MSPDPQQNPPTFQDTVQVTATRFGEPVAEVPGSISAVTGDEIRARGATDLRTALALLGGVSVAPGGDAGPAGAVPGLIGVREVDDLLLLIDGIPAGGAFIPQIEAISLNNVERIEVIGWSDALYEDYVTDIDGKPTQLAGNHQVLTPRVRVGGGLLYAPDCGWRGSSTSNWIGDHWLNSLNTFESPAYAIVDASLGYRFEKFTIAVLGSNLGDRRDTVQLSELGEGQF